MEFPSMINATVFGSTTSSVQWKAVTSASSSGAPAVFQPSGGAADKVSVSKLGQALSGVAADAFKHLDSKARGALENLVNSGQISADDAVLGLRSMATSATFSRYGRERPRDQDDVQRLAASESLLDKQRGLNDRMGAAREAFGQAFAGLQKAQERGELSMDQVREGLRPAQEAFDSQLAAINEERSTLDGASSLEAGYEKTVKGFNAAMAPMISESGFTEAFSEKANAAAQKLQQLGFGAKVFGNAFKDFAATVDIPGIGRAAGAVAPPAEPEAPAAEASAPAGTPVETVLTAAKATGPKPDSPAAKTAKPAADPRNAQQAAAMLKSALEGGGKRTTGLFGSVSDNGGDASDSVLNSLVESLKAGAGKDKADAASSS